MSNNPQNNKENNFRLHWKAIYEYNTGFQTILYRIENYVIYRIDITNKLVSIVANEGQVIPTHAKPISQEDYERYLLIHIV